jgi:hypothetical protein
MATVSQFTKTKQQMNDQLHEDAAAFKDFSQRNMSKALLQL